MMKKIGIGWQVGVASGWGTYGVNLAFQLAKKGVEPAIFFSAKQPVVTEEQISVLGPYFADAGRWHKAVRGPNATFDFPVLLGLGDKLLIVPELEGIRGKPSIGVVFFESAQIPPDRLAAAEDRFALIITGSSWNAEVLKRHGFTRVANCPQGVDLELFHPAPRQGHFAGRFAVFSGGKLEYRKGQDIVVAAFKRFHARYPDALLVTAWHSPWPSTANSLTHSPHITAMPGLAPDGRLDVIGWLMANGLPSEAVIDLGTLANADSPAVLREMDLAVFPNRCEGGTNLVAMECMACGVPVALSRNTGHLDLIAADNCYSLDLQIPMGAVTGHADLEDWGETSIDELANVMERAYLDRADAAARGAAGSAFMSSWDWSTQVDRFLDAIKTVW